MKDKSFLSWKEARLEAEIRLSIERKNPSESSQSSPNHCQGPNDNVNHHNANSNNRDSFVNTSLRGKAFALSESIAETDYTEAEVSTAITESEWRAITVISRLRRHTAIISQLLTSDTEHLLDGSVGAAVILSSIDCCTIFDIWHDNRIFGRER